MNRFQRGQAWLNKRFIQHAKVDIIYHRGDSEISLSVWVGVTPFKITENGNTRLEWSERDYLIPVSALVLDDVQLYPEKNDWIEEAMPEGVQQYMLMAPNNEPVWRYSDTQHTVFRVHCKRVVA